MMLLRYPWLIAFLLLPAAGCRHEPRGLAPGGAVHIRIPEPKSAVASYAAALYCEGTREYFAYAGAQTKKIQLIDIHTGQPARNIPLNAIDTLADLVFYKPKFYIRAPDSVFVLPDESKTVFLLDSDGRVRRRWDLFRTEAHDFVLSAYPTNPLQFCNRKLYVRYVPKLDPFNEKAAYFRIAPALTINIDDPHQDIRQAGGWPERYRRECYYNPYPYVCIHTGRMPEQLVYSYAAEPELYIYEGTRLVQKSFAGSSAIPAGTPFNEDSTGNTAYIMRYLTTAPKYANIIYDPYRQLFYRLALHPTTPLSEDGRRLKQPFDQPWSLIVLDRQYRKLREVDFDPARYASGPMYVCREGLMIPKRKSRQEEVMGRYEWDFVIFKPEL